MAEPPGGPQLISIERVPLEACGQAGGGGDSGVRLVTLLNPTGSLNSLTVAMAEAFKGVLEQLGGDAGARRGRRVGKEGIPSKAQACLLELGTEPTRAAARRPASRSATRDSANPMQRCIQTTRLHPRTARRAGGGHHRPRARLLGGRGLRFHSGPAERWGSSGGGGARPWRAARNPGASSRSRTAAPPATSTAPIIVDVGARNRYRGVSPKRSMSSPQHKQPEAWS